MSPTVDDILASGWYRDRQGRVWVPVYGPWPTYWMDIDNHQRQFTPDEMRLLVLRDRHRGECPGLRKCVDHPVPYVLARAWAYSAYTSGPPWDCGGNYDTLPEALAAAVRMSPSGLAKEGR